MFERVKVLETIYEVVVEPSYQKTNISDTKHADHSS